MWMLSTSCLVGKFFESRDSSWCSKKAKNIILNINWSQQFLQWGEALGKQDEILFGKAREEAIGYKGFWGSNGKERKK